MPQPSDEPPPFRIGERVTWWGSADGAELRLVGVDNIDGSFEAEDLARPGTIVQGDLENVCRKSAAWHTWSAEYGAIIRRPRLPFARVGEEAKAEAHRALHAAHPELYDELRREHPVLSRYVGDNYPLWGDVRRSGHRAPHDYTPRTSEERRFLEALLPSMPDADIWPRGDAPDHPWLLISLDIVDDSGIGAVPRLDFDGRSLRGAYSPASLNGDAEYRAADAGLGPDSPGWIDVNGSPEELADAAVSWFLMRVHRWREELGR